MPEETISKHAVSWNQLLSTEKTSTLLPTKHSRDETEDYIDEFVDREDYEFFRDHCHVWSPEKLKEKLEVPGFITGDEDDFTLNIGIINKCTRKFAVLDLTFIRLSL